MILVKIQKNLYQEQWVLLRVEFHKVTHLCLSREACVSHGQEVSSLKPSETRPLKSELESLPLLEVNQALNA